MTDELDIIKLPLLQNFVIKKKHQVGNIFADKCIIMCLHFLRDLLPFTNGLKELGAQPENCWLIAKPYPYPYKQLVKEVLNKDGFHILIAEKYPIEDVCNEILHVSYRHCLTKKLKMLVIEDGGHIGEQILFLEDEDKDLIIGAIEQTTKGYRKYKQLKDKGKLSFPVLSVASPEFKHDYESRFIGKTVVTNIRKFKPNFHFSGKKALVFGYGSIGSMVAHYLRIFEGMIVDICEKDSRKLLLAKQDNFNAKKGINEFSDKNWALVVGCTGGYEEGGEVKPTISEEVITQLNHGCTLVSASSDQVEIDIDVLDRYSDGKAEPIYIQELIQEVDIGTGEEQTISALLRRIKLGTKYTLTLLRRTSSPPVIHLLADGYPINFYSSESVPNESIDPIMTAIFLSTVFLAQNYDNLENELLEKEVDEIIKNENMIETFLRLHGMD